MKKLRLVIGLLVIAVLITACGGQPETVIEYASVAQDAAEPGDFEQEVLEVSGEAAFNSATAGTDDTLPDQQSIPQERLIIRTGDLSLVVQDTEEMMADIERMVAEAGGWVVSSEVYQYNDTAFSGSITVRIPADGYGSMMEAIKALALEVQRETSDSEDVTEEYVDLSSRLENLEATAARVRNFLDEARNVEEALAVNQELSRLEEQIEVIKGRMQYLSQSAAFSTITIRLTPDEAVQPIQVGGWQPQGIAKDAIEALVDALQGLGNVLIWVVLFLLPMAIVLGVPLWLVVRFARRRWRQRRSGTEAPASSE